MSLLRLASLALICLGCFSQPRMPDIAAQKEAMKKFAFLVGKWSGEATATRGPGAPVKMTQTEDVQMRLDGLILQVEGTGRDAETGKVLFNALGTISYDDATRVYHFRSYSDGRYLDTTITPTGDGFEWGFDMGPAKVRYVMKLSESGEWVEKGTVTMGEAPPRPVVEIRVKKQ